MPAASSAQRFLLQPNTSSSPEHQGWEDTF